MNKRLLISGIIMFVIGLAMALVGAFVVLGINDFAFCTLFVFGCTIALIGFIFALVGISSERY